MKKLFIVALLLAGVSVQAQESLTPAPSPKGEGSDYPNYSITEEQAREIASEFFFSRGYEGTEVRGYEFFISRGYEGTEVRGYEDSLGVEGNLAPSYPRTPASPNIKLAYQAPKQKLFVFNDTERKGFVIVSGNEQAENPILGWSDNGPFDYENAPCGLKALLARYAEDISRYEVRGTWYENSFSAEGNLAPSKTLAPRNENAPRKANVVVGPLLTTQWSQGKPYNDQCPVMNEGMPPTGCVATAMAQIMNYWQWPEQGYGKHTNHRKETGERKDFTQSHYDWDSMLPTYTEGNYTETEGKAVAQLMADVGCSLDMIYSTSALGSAAVITSVYQALVTFFDYSYEDIRLATISHNLDEINSLLCAELDASRPVLCSIATPKGAHAIVCDGYNADGYFHLNYGWGGEADGYYLPSAVYGLDSHGLPLSMFGHECVIGIHPSDGERVLADHVYYELKDGMASVVGCYDNTPETEQCDIVIPEKLSANGKDYEVNSLWEAAFKGSKISSVNIPGTIKKIPHYAFSDRAGDGSDVVPIERVVINDGVEEIDDEAFRYCDNLKELTMSKTVRRIGKEAFRQCGLTNVGSNWGDRLETVDDGAFWNCPSLSSIPTLPATLKYIGDFAFAGLNKINWITIKGKGYTIGENAFYDSGVTFAFGLENAAEIKRGSGIKLSGEFTVQPTCIYGEEALWAATVVLPAALKSFDKNTVVCTNVYRVEEGNPSYASADGVLYSKDMQTLINCPTGALSGSHFTVPAGVKKLGPGSMSGSYVTIPASVKEMDGAFSRNFYVREVTCLGTTPIAISSNTFDNAIHTYGYSVLNVPVGSKQQYEQANEWKLFNNIRETVAVTDKFCYSVDDEQATASVIGRNTEVAFDGKADIPASMTSGGKTYTVNGASLPNDRFIKSLSLPESFENRVGDFHGCTNLQTVILPNSIRTINNEAFWDCPKLANVTLGNSVERIEQKAFIGCTGLKSISFPESVCVIEKQGFENCGLEKVTFLGTGYSIGEKAFNGCQSLSQVVGLENVGYVNNQGFANCALSGDLTFSSSLQTLDALAFAGNNITSVSLPDTEFYIDGYAFQENSQFHSFIVAADNEIYFSIDGMLFERTENWEDGSPMNALEGCPPMQKVGGSIVRRDPVVVPEGTHAIWCQLGMNKIHHVVLPASLTELDYTALGTAHDLYSVTVKATTPLEIDEWTFSEEIFNRPSLTLYVPKGCISVYRAAPYWEQFPNIREIGDVPTNIEDNNQYTITNNPSGADAVYDLQGRRLDNGYCKPGVYIVGGKKIVIR